MSVTVMSVTQSSLGGGPGVRKRSALAVQRSRGAGERHPARAARHLGCHHSLPRAVFGYTFGVTAPWFFTYDRLWLDILPGIAVALGRLTVRWVHD